MNILKYIKLYIIRNFKVITINDAVTNGLTFSRNIYGDEVNTINCRSLWVDTHGKVYRVKQLYTRVFDIDEFNDWFKNEFNGYDGRVGASGIFLRCDKLTPNWIEEYMKHIGQDISYDNIMFYYDVVRKNWINQLGNV